MIALCLMFVAISIRQVLGISNFTEDNLFMLTSDIKVIRLKDFFRCGITSNFKFEAIDPLAENLTDSTTKLPNYMRIHRSKYMKYELDKIDTENSTAKDLTDTEDVLYVGDDYFILRNKKEFGIFTVNYNQSTNQNIGAKYLYSFNVSGSSPHEHFISDGNYFMIFVDNNNTKSGTIQYYVVDPNNSTNMTQSRASGRFNLRNTLSSYKFSKDFSRNKEYRLLGWMTSFAVPQDVFFECNATFVSQWTVKCRNLSIMLPTDIQQNYSMITASFHNASSIKIVVKANNYNNNFSYSICSYENIQGTLGFNCKLFIDIPIALLSDTKSRPIDFGEGHFGIWTEQFLLHSLDLNYQKMEKTYLQVYNPQIIINTTVYEIAFATKNSKFISIAVFNSFNGRDKRIIDYYAVIELGLSPPEILIESSIEASYFRLQDSKLFRNQKTQNGSIRQLGYGFQDAYIEVQGHSVESKLNINPSATTETLQFRILAEGGDGVSNFKDFNITLIREALGVSKLEIPFDTISLIRGGKISLTLFEEYAVGNDLSLKIEAKNQAVEVKTISDRLFEVELGQNLSEHQNHIYKVVLLWDNMALFASNKTDPDSNIFICYLTVLPETSNKKETAFCEVIFSTLVKPNRVLKEATLLNFKHLLVVFEAANQPAWNKDKYSLHFAVIYLIEKNATSNSSNYLSADVEFFCSRANQSFITYTYPGSAVIIYLIDDFKPTPASTTTQDYIKMINFQQLANNSFVHSLVDVEYDTTRITSLYEISPDYSTKNYFYLGVTELGVKKKTHYSYISEINKNGALVGLLQTSKKIEEANSVSVTGTTSYCGARDELIILNFNHLPANNTNATAIKPPDKLSTKPFRTKYQIQERMLRRLPLTTLGYNSIIAFDCMDERNNLIIIATNETDFSKKNKTGEFAIVNYEMTYVSDPRKRVETIIDLPADFNSRDVLINAKSFSSQNKDFALTGYLSNGDPTKRKFLYAEMPVKVMKFELMCPQHVSNKFDFNVSIPRSSSTTMQSCQRQRGTTASKKSF